MPIDEKTYIGLIGVLISLPYFTGSFTTNATAQSCTASVPVMDFGTVDLSGGGSVNTSNRIRINCTGTPGERVRVCLNFGSGTGNVNPSGDPRYMLNGANQLDYNIYKNGARTNVWGSWVWPYAPIGKSVNVRIGNNGRGRKNTRMRGQIKAGQSGTPPGVYISSFAGAHTLLSYAYRSVGNCNTISGLGGVQVPFVVTANVIGACTVNATDLNFGNVGLLNSNIDTSNTISVQCSPGIPYSIGLSNGSSGGTSPTNRFMTAGGNSTVYGIYSNNSRSTAWGNTIGVNTVAGVGTGTNQNYVGYGRVPTQPTPPSGIYTDTVTITLTY